MKTVNRKQLHETIGSFIDKSLDKSQSISVLIVIGREGIGKTSIMLEEAKERNLSPKIDVPLDLKAGDGRFGMVEFDSFIWIKTEYYGNTHTLNEILKNVLLNRAAPIFAPRSKMRSLIFEIDCQEGQEKDFSQAFEPLEVVYYQLTKEDFKEWAEEINSETGLPNVDAAILPMVLASFR